MITEPFFQFLLFLTTFTGNFGVAIITFTLLLRTVLVPLTIPALKSQKAMQALKPKLDRLRTLYKNDQARLQQEQLQLYKEHNLNPMAGCLPYLVQIVVLLILYNVLLGFLAKAEGMGFSINHLFLGFDLGVPDSTYILAILAGVTQFILSLMILPGVEQHDLVENDSTSPEIKKENEKETDTQKMAEQIQKQMVFMMPVITGVAAAQFPAGLALYWVVSTVFSIVQQWFVTGPGGLFLYAKKLLKFLGLAHLTQTAAPPREVGSQLPSTQIITGKDLENPKTKPMKKERTSIKATKKSSKKPAKVVRKGKK